MLQWVAFTKMYLDFFWRSTVWLAGHIGDGYESFYVMAATWVEWEVEICVSIINDLKWPVATLPQVL